MKLFTEAIVIVILINASSAFHWTNPKNHSITYQWNGDINEESNGNNCVKNITVSDIFAGEDYHRIAHLNCNFTEPNPEYCDLIIQTHNFNDTSHQTTCIINLPKTTLSIEEVKVLQENTVLIGWVTDYPANFTLRRIKYQLTSTDTCKSKGFAAINESEDKYAEGHSILAYDDHFDIVFHERGACRGHEGHYCRVSYANNLENFLREEPKSKTINFTHDDKMFILNDLYPMKDFHENAAVVIGHWKLSRSSEYEQVYSPVTHSWTEIKSSVWKLHSFSNSSGYATLCWSSMNKMKAMDCMRLDGTRKFNDTLRLIFTKPFESLPYIHNKPDGSIVLVRAAADRHFKKGKIVIDQGHVMGWCERIVEVEVQDVEIKKFELTIKEHNTYCISYIGKMDPKVKGKKPIQKTFVTRCVKGKDDEINKLFDCSDEHYYV